MKLVTDKLRDQPIYKTCHFRTFVKFWSEVDFISTIDKVTWLQLQNSHVSHHTKMT